MPSDSFPPPGYFLRIKNWDEHFERAQTRKVSSPLSWIALPTKHDGSKFRRLVSTKRGLTIFGAFCLLIEVAAKMDKRGDFVRHDLSTLNCADLEAITGADRRTFEAAIKELCLPQFGWLELVAVSDLKPSTLPTRSDMREEKRRKEKSNGLSSVFEAVGQCCGLELDLIDARTAQKINVLVEDLRGKYDDWTERELAETIQAFGHWYFEIEWKGHRPTVDVLRTKWKSFREWQLTGGKLRGDETEEEMRKRGLTPNGNPLITAPG